MCVPGPAARSTFASTDTPPAPHLQLTDFAATALPIIAVASNVPSSPPPLPPPPSPPPLPPSPSPAGTAGTASTAGSPALFTGLSNTNWIIVLSIAAGLLLLGFVLIVFLCCRLRRAQSPLQQQPSDVEAGKKLQRIPATQIAGVSAATAPKAQAINRGVVSSRLAGAANPEEVYRQLRSFADNNVCSRCGGGLALRKREHAYYVRCTKCRSVEA